MAKWQKIKIKIRKDLGPAQRIAVGREIIEHIKQRTAQGKAIDGKKWKGSAGVYSKSYKESDDFKIAGKSNKVNLDLSSEMMNSINVLSHSRGEVNIGYNKGDKELNGKVEGNRLGTYGNKSSIRGKKRDFLGIKRSSLTTIQDRYDFKREDSDIINGRIDRLNKVFGDDDA